MEQVLNVQVFEIIEARTCHVTTQFEKKLRILIFLQSTLVLRPSQHTLSKCVDIFDINTLFKRKYAGFGRNFLKL